MAAANGQRTVDAVTTQSMLQAFDAAQAECKIIQNGVTNAQGELAGLWQGEASAKYNNSMSEWLAGFQKVQAALLELNGSMGVYRQVTNATEATNSGLGTGWAGGHA
jgi:WXG100 family type VII secretion target